MSGLHLSFSKYPNFPIITPHLDFLPVTGESAWLNIIFLKKVYFYFFNRVCVCVCVYGSKRILGPLELELGGCELPNMGAGNWTLFCARATSSLNC